MTSKVFHVRADTRVHLFLRALCGSLPRHPFHPGSAPECCLPRGILRASLLAQRAKNLLAMQETQIQPLSQEDPQEKEWLPTPAFLPGEFHERGA